MPCRRLSLAVCLSFVTWLAAAPTGAGDKSADPHYNAAGFFDIHVCNWPDRPPFYLALFSTERFAEVAGITISDARGDLVGNLDLGEFRTLERKGKPAKRVFIRHIEIPAATADGWFEADIMLDNGEHHTARDFVTHQLLGRASGHIPPRGAGLDKVPASLAWDRIDGAGFYQVFIRDLWQDGKLIYSSKLIEQNRIDLPPGLLEQGGYYAWKVHARDVNEDPRLGDFNIGSQSEWVKFSIE